MFSPDQGLGLNLVRYIIPGGASLNLNPQLMFCPERSTPRFLRHPSGLFNWFADPHQRAALVAAKALEAYVFYAVANSPPWWLK